MGSLNTITGQSIYLDANILIYAVEDLTAVGQKIRTLFSRFDSGELHAVTSELSLAEVLAKPIRDGKQAIQDEYEQFLTNSDALTVMPVTRDVLIRAAQIRAQTSVKLPDAIHAATSLLKGCTTFLTNDQRFAAITSLPVLLLSQVL